MLFVGRIRILHIKEELTGQFAAIATALKTFLIAGAIVHRAHFGGHHLLSPEGRSFYINAPGAGSVIKFTLIAYQSAS